jgi:hypothetical protein
MLCYSTPKISHGGGRSVNDYLQTKQHKAAIQVAPSSTKLVSFFTEFCAGKWTKMAATEEMFVCHYLNITSFAGPMTAHRK